MTTANDLILQALKGAGVLGVGQVASAEDINDAKFQLNLLLDDWSVKRYVVYHLIDTAKVSTGAVSYTVGSGGDFDIEAPDKLEGAFFRQFPTSGGLPVDYPLNVLYARQDYNRIVVKGMGTWPMDVFYDAAYPLGNLYVWPIPSASIFEIHITTKAVLSEVTNVAASLNLPRVYRNALFWNLAANIRPLYQLPPDPTVTARAKASMSALRQANVQVPRAQIPEALLRRGGAYNIYSDDQ